AGLGLHRLYRCLVGCGGWWRIVLLLRRSLSMLLEHIVGVELVAAARKGLDDLPALLVAEQLAERVDLLIEAALTYHAAWPRIAHQLLPAHHLARGLQQTCQQARAGLSQLAAPLLLAALHKQLKERGAEADIALVTARSKQFATARLMSVCSG